MSYKTFLRAQKILSYAALASIIFISFFYSASAQAKDLYLKKEEPVKELTSKDFANQYFQNCVEAENKTLTSQSQEMLCACSAAKLSENMSIEEMKAMQQDSAFGQEMRNKMLLEVYAPCIEFPTHDLVLASCLNDPTKLPQKKEVCHCLASSMGQYISQNAQVALMSALQQNPNSLDPLGTLLESPSFNAKSQKIFGECVQKYALKP